MALVVSTDSPADTPDAVFCEASKIAYLIDSLLPGLAFDQAKSSCCRMPQLTTSDSAFVAEWKGLDTLGGKSQTAQRPMP